MTGFILLGLIAYSLEIQCAEIISIAFHGNFVWLLRLLHMLCANFVIISTLVHLGKALSFSQVASPQKFLVWLVGSVIFLLSLATAFTGYVVVSGNMSYGAALVILNLFSVVQVLGEEIVSGILSAATATSGSIRRLTAIHFLLALASAAAFVLHIILLHRTAPAKSNSEAPINTETLGHVVVKDLSIFLIAVLPVFFESTKTLVHPDNWQAYSRLITPAHIEPEIYFLGTFSVIKLHNGEPLEQVRINFGALAVCAFLMSTAFALQLLDTCCNNFGNCCIYYLNGFGLLWLINLIL